MHLQNVLPADIEKRSMEIIGEELGQIHIDEEKIDIVSVLSIPPLILIMPAICCSPTA